MATEWTDAGAAGLVGDVDPHRYDWAGVFGDGDDIEVPGIVSRWLSPRSRVLDVGCGTGAMTALVGRRVTGTLTALEPNPARAAAARTRGLDVTCGVLDESFLAGREPFEAIMFLDVLEHLVDPAEILSIARKGLAPGGYVIASVPNVAHWTVRLKLLLGKFDYVSQGIMDVTHLRWFTRKSFRLLFEQAGFEVVEFKGSAGAWLDAYRYLPKGLRYLLAGGLAKLFPGAFACQHIIRARVHD